MRKLLLGCAVVGFIALLPRSEAKIPASVGILPWKTPTIQPLTLLPLKREVGWASWYGEELQGEPTASGEPYDMNGLTAAHRDLPLGTKVQVTNLRNKRTVLLRINDRGPSLGGRLIDVSWAAARRLGFVHAGLTRVKLRVVQYPKNVAPESASAGPTTN